MNQNKLSKIIILSSLVLLFVLTTGAIVLRPPMLGLAQPRTTPQPTPAPAPTPEPQQVTLPATRNTADTSMTMPDGAVDVVVSRRALFAMESEAAAAFFFGDYLATAGQAGLAENEVLLKASLEQEISLVPAGGGQPLLTAAEAMELLLENPALAPLSREVARCEEITYKIPAQMTSTRALPSGSRLIESVGAAEKWLVYSETTFKSGVECSYVETNRFRVGEERERAVLLGAYTNKVAGSIGKDEGVAGRKPAGLRFGKPLAKGSISSYFGWHGSVWSGGIGYQAPAGTKLLAPEDGVVIFCGLRGDYGFVIDIRHDDGFVSRFSHCADVRVELWERVKKGAAIAMLKEDEQLHFELIADGIPVNPLQYL